MGTYGQWLSTAVRGLWFTPPTDNSTQDAWPPPHQANSMSDVLADAVTSVTFTINGTQHTVPGNLKFKLTLNDYLRYHAGLTGTKQMCAEGGCGACVVMATHTDPSTKATKKEAINSCLCLVYAIDGWSITTTEGIGSKSTGFHQVQERIAEYNGSQCGACTPGQVMSMYSLLQEDARPSKEKVEATFGGNICRCTGYRPILDAFKSFSPDAAESSTLPTGCIDIEDLGKHGCCGSCKGKGHCDRKPAPLAIRATGGEWYRPTTLSQLLLLLEEKKTQKVRMIAGNTAVGVYKDNVSTVYIDVKSIPDLYATTVTDALVKVGGGVTLTTLIKTLQSAANLTGYGYCQQVADHILIVASVPIRNAGSVAGNLMMKHAHNDFLSDIFTLLEAVGAKLTISSSTQKVERLPSEFLTYTMAQKVIESITFPKFGTNEVFRSFKPMPRAENAHALVNAAFRMEVDSEYRVTSIPRLVFGGISGSFIHASSTENYLFNKQLTGQSVLHGALIALEAEIIPVPDPVLSSPTYRRNLSCALFYKFILGVCEDVVSARLQSGGPILERPLSSGKQEYPTDSTKWPLTKAIPKITAKLQASGEAQYMDDMPLVPGELHAAFVLTTQGNATIDAINATEALKIPGVVKFLSASDIPTGGQNNFTPWSTNGEEVLCSGQVTYAGQPVGIIVAEDRQTALAAAELVMVTYKNIQTPLLTVEDAITAGSFFPSAANPIIKGDADSAISASDKVIEGEVSFKTQYHFTIETQSSRVVPTEDGYDVYPTTQRIDFIQQAVAAILNIKNSDVRCEVKRIGGAYGCKISRNSMVSAACALAAYSTKKPVRMVMDLPTNMKAIGKRCSYVGKYKVGVTNAGKLNGVKLEYFVDCGNSPNDNSASMAQNWADNSYFCNNWDVSSRLVKTNVPSTTWTRAPGSVPAIYIIETMMEQVAKELSMDPLSFKQLNLYVKDQTTHNNMPLTYCNIREMVTQLSTSAELAKRKAEISTFNASNRWKKRGLGTVPLKYGAEWDGIHYNVLVSIHNGDGTVSISHGGIEIGQGINTKAAQVAAHILDIDMSEITIRPSGDHQNANSSTTGGSTSSELCCLGVQQACTELNRRMAPVKATMTDPTWAELVKECYARGVDLTARKWVVTESDHVFKYNVYGVTFAEVELDVLTGESIVMRADMLYDAGESMNPDVDIGQVEGAFVMGSGYWRSEQIIYDETTGVNLTNNTWEYKPPVHKDIPVDFRITLLKDAPNPVGVLRSKLVGEPPLCMACSVLFAQKEAIQAARAEVASTDYFKLGAPGTVEVAQTLCLPDIKNYVLTETTA